MDPEWLQWIAKLRAHLMGNDAPEAPNPLQSGGYGGQAVDMKTGEPMSLANQLREHQLSQTNRPAKQAELAQWLSEHPQTPQDKALWQK